MVDDDGDDKRLTLQECADAFALLFPQGPAGADVLAELAPDGWDKSELLLAAHPTPKMLFEEATRLHNNIENLCKNLKKDQEPPMPPPTMKEFTESYKEVPVDSRMECADIVGKCLWVIFSDNHDVIAPDGRMADIGSFRGAGEFIAQWMTEALTDDCYDYMDFYMGTYRISQRADMSPVYRLIFRRLKRLGFGWKYSFPRIGVVQMGPFSKETSPDGAGYDLSAALEQEQAAEKKQRDFEEMRERLRVSYNESVKEARTLPPPEIVKAYMSVYGRAPGGWPPIADEGE
jgi:hypothetical protein